MGSEHTVVAPCGHQVPAHYLYCGLCGAPLATASDGAERRLLTILFCDLVGSTALSSRLDPEDLSQILTTYYAACAEIVTHYEGHVAQHMGDGVLAYFGYPVAHEDDARRAVAAGLDIVGAVPNLRWPAEAPSPEVLATRIGIHTGLTVLGFVGSGSSRQPLAVGETPNIAARLQSIAPRNAIVISEDTRRLVERDFELLSMGVQSLRGIDRGIDASVVTSARRRDAPLPVLPAGSAVPMVGRTQELDAIVGAFDRAAAGEPRVVVIAGEPGIGKTRLLQGVHDALQARGPSWVGAHCHPFYRNSAFYAGEQLLRQLTGIPTSTPADERLAALERLLDTHGCRAGLSFFAEALNLPAAEPAGGLQLSAQARKSRLLESVVVLVEAMARVAPIVLAVEDVQWADPSTSELLEHLAHAASGSPLLLVLTCRTVDAVPWHPAAEAIVLAPLDDDEGRQLVRLLAGDAPMTSDTTGEILGRADGLPLAIEELTKAAAQDLHRLPPGDSPGRRPQSAVPYHLHSLLADRLDRLGPAKQIAQLAATIARTVNASMLEQLAGCSSDTLRAYLNQLVEAGILTTVVPAGSSAGRGDVDLPAEASFQFRHALLREVAYDSLLKRTRLGYHARIAELLEGDASEIEERPELVAYHWSTALFPDRALPHFIRAAERAKRRFANREAATLYARAVESLQELAGGHQAAYARWYAHWSTLLEDLGDMRHLLAQPGQAEAAYREAISRMVGVDDLEKARISRKIGIVFQQQPDRALRLYDVASGYLGEDRPDRDRAWRQEWLNLQLARMRSFYWFNQSDQIIELADLVKPHIDASGTPLQRADFFNQLTLAGVRRERYAASGQTLGYARDYLRAAIESGDLIETTSARLTVGVVLLCRGEYLDAVAELGEALALARRAGHVTFEVRCLTYLSTAHRCLGDVTTTQAYCSELMRQATEKRMVEYAGMARSNLAWAALATGDTITAHDHARGALGNWEAFQVPYPFQWTARFPLLALALRDGDLTAAYEHARAMLQPEQHALPALLTQELERLVQSAAGGDERAARPSLKRAVELAQALNFISLPAPAGHTLPVLRPAEEPRKAPLPGV